MYSVNHLNKQLLLIPAFTNIKLIFILKRKPSYILLMNIEGRKLARQCLQQILPFEFSDLHFCWQEAALS